MNIEIWSDIACPFCYIGKREFEKALQQFSEKEEVKVEWKSYQLSPDMITDPTANSYETLAAHKGISVAQARQMYESVAERARGTGLHFQSDKIVPANTLKAHCFSHFAKTQGKQNEAEELLFRSYFIDGKNIDDESVLAELAVELNLNAEAFKRALEKNLYTEAVRSDIYEAFQLGVRGVPFFVFDRKYAVSGAQSSRIFLQTLTQSFNEWKGNKGESLKVQAGETCDINGNCN